MTTIEGHAFSTFALDVYWASGKPKSPALETHLDTCSRCREYLEHLAVLGMSAPPAWIAIPGRSPERPLRAKAYARSAAVVGGLAVLAVAMLVLRPLERDKTNGPYVGVKGTPAVQVLIQRQGRSHIWDGRTPVRPGDALAFRVGCEGFAHVAVATRAPSVHRWTRLTDNVCPRDSAPLPFSLIVDAEPGEERLVVLLSEGRLDDRALDETAERAGRDRDAWVVPFVFPKEVGR